MNTQLQSLCQFVNVSNLVNSSQLRMEMFGIYESSTSDAVQKLPHQQCNIHDGNEKTFELVIGYLQDLLIAGKSSKETDHSYILSEAENTIRNIKILHDAICLWRTYTYLRKKFGNKIISQWSIGLESRIVSQHGQGEGDPEGTMQMSSIAHSLGFKVVEEMLLFFLLQLFLIFTHC